MESTFSITFSVWEADKSRRVMSVDHHIHAASFDAAHRRARDMIFGMKAAAPKNEFSVASIEHVFNGLNHSHRAEHPLVRAFDLFGQLEGDDE